MTDLTNKLAYCSLQSTSKKNAFLLHRGTNEIDKNICAFLSSVRKSFHSLILHIFLFETKVRSTQTPKIALLLFSEFIALNEFI